MNGFSTRLRSRHYLLITGSLILSIISLSLVTLVYIKISNEHLVFDFQNDSNYIAFLTVIAGVLAGFSFLSIYSIFNANVDSQKSEIEQLISNLDIVKNEIESDSKLDKDTGEYVSSIIHMNNLIHPFIDKTNKIIALQYFNELENINNGIVKIIGDYYHNNQSTIETTIFNEKFSTLIDKWTNSDLLVRR